jgi:hypothetical protein
MLPSERIRDAFTVTDRTFYGRVHSAGEPSIVASPAPNARHGKDTGNCSTAAGRPSNCEPANLLQRVGRLRLVPLERSELAASHSMEMGS